MKEFIRFIWQMAVIIMCFGATAICGAMLSLAGADLLGWMNIWVDGIAYIVTDLFIIVAGMIGAVWFLAQAMKVTRK